MANWVSCPAATTSAPGGRPLRWAAWACTCPITCPGSRQAGNQEGSTPARASIWGDQSRCARSMAIVVQAAVGSTEASPQSCLLSSPAIISQRVLSRAAGACWRSHMNLSRVLKEITW